MRSPSAVPARARYACFAELARHETLGKDYRVRVHERAGSSILVAAPHGGMIEAGTSEIAALIAGEDYHLFSFEGTKPYGENRALHITSHRFDHPACLELASRVARVLTIHGCLGDSRIHVGGLDDELSARLGAALGAAGFKVEWPSARYPGRHPLNICNRGSSAKGVQLEITYDLRAGADHAAIAAAVRAGLAGAR
ncbi:MAG TPA: poly-gamma-glutamate hydrolase family protein [Steroidobacteraceae bacterium]|jgi:phage replication-related protein YjqB (UPF0714/DUF867 family)|nr:poly-gamma-glutamate hydrolase family protein [Steroidobacteraceae bacterium]